MLAGMTDSAVVEPLSGDDAHTPPATSPGRRAFPRPTAARWAVHSGKRVVTITALVALAAAANLTPSAVAPAYAAPDARTLTLLTVPAGATTGFAEKINNRGQIVGGIDRKAAFWSADNRITMLPVPAGTTESSAIDLNDAGIAVGYVGNGHRTRAAVWDTPRGTVALLAPDERRSTMAKAINERGEIVGFRERPHRADGSSDGEDAVRFVDLEVVPIPGGMRAMADTIADDSPSTVVGSVRPSRSNPECGCGAFPWQSRDVPAPRPGNILGPPDPGFAGAIDRNGTRIVGQSKRRAAIWDLVREPGRTPVWRLRPLIGDARSGADTYFEGVNGRGTIAVGAKYFDGVWNAVVYENGTLSELRGLDGAANDVNDSGVIVGAVQVFDNVPALWR
jgi:uncharacterized membrane protein